MRNVGKFALVAAIAAVALMNASPIVRAAADDGTSGSGVVDAKADAAARDAVKTAALALQKEYEAHLARKTAPIRTKSDFFTENSNPAVTPKAIIEALNRSYGEEATSVYVHWQLLSGLPAKVDKSLAPDLTDAYEDAPIGPTRPGLDPGQKVEYTQAIAQLPESQAQSINTAFEKLVKQWEEASKPFTEYRDALAKHLPPTFELVQTQERDAIERASNGIDGAATMTAAISNGRNWALGQDASAQEIQQIVGDVTSILREMGDQTALLNGDWPSASSNALALGRPDSEDLWGDLWTVGRVRALPKPVAIFPPKFFTEVAWNGKTRSLEWKTGSAKFESKAELVSFRKALIEAANQPDSIKAKTSGGAS